MTLCLHQDKGLVFILLKLINNDPTNYFTFWTCRFDQYQPIVAIFKHHSYKRCALKHCA